MFSIDDLFVLFFEVLLQNNEFLFVLDRSFLKILPVLLNNKRVVCPRVNIIIDTLCFQVF